MFFSQLIFVIWISWKKYEQISMKFCGGVGQGPRARCLDFSGYSDSCVDSGSLSIYNSLPLGNGSWIKFFLYSPGGSTIQCPRCLVASSSY